MTIRLLAGDCRDVLPTLAADSVHCVVCSPPYWNLRDYQTGTWDGGDAACDHEARANRADRPRNGLTGGLDTIEAATIYRATCGKCGARRIDRQIGLERDPSEYLATMVAVFREVRRVMRNDAVAFINMGDGYRDKQLLLMPARLALALQSDGWWVRSDIIWHKPNPMPESVTDRCVSAHEHVFMLTKAPRYYFDADAIREGREGDTHSRGVKRNPPIDSAGVGHKDWCSYMTRDDEITSRACRNVWTIATSPFSAAHFATFPPELAERCIRAGTSERGCCAACGKPWRRIVEKPKPPRDVYTQRHAPTDEMIYSGTRVDGEMVGKGQKLQDWLNANPAITTGWAPGCDHGADVVPCRVLDPFAGAGTTLLCSDRLQRDAIGIELNVAYTEMAMERCRADAPLFTSFPPAEDPEETRIADLFAGDEYQQMPAAVPKPQRVPTGWDTGPGAHGTIHRNGRTMPEAAE